MSKVERSLVDKFSSKVAADGLPAAASTLARYARNQIRAGRERAFLGRVGLVSAVVGASAADVYFCRSSPSWTNVQDRVLELHATGPETVGSFVRTCLATTSDATVVIGLARHPLTRDDVRQWLIEQFDNPSRELGARLTSSRVLGAAIAGAARLLLPSPRGAEVMHDVEERYEIPDKRFHQFVDSLGFQIASASTGEARLDRGPCAHRLVVIERIEDETDLALLLGGAEKATVLVTSDTFGRLDLSEIEAWCGLQEIAVEHVRTRIARFSPAYIELHEATAALAEAVLDVLRESDFHVPVDLEPMMQLGIADFLFFQALRIRAMEELLEDDGFDHVVIATDSLGRSREFLRSVRAVENILSDPRVDMVSVSASAPERQRFWSLIDEFVQPTEAALRAYEGVSFELISRKLDEEARRLADAMDSHTSSGRSPVMVATSGAPAYLDSTPAYVAELNTTYDTSVLVIGGDAESLNEAIDSTSLAGFDVLGIAPGRFAPLADSLAPLFQQMDGIAGHVTPASMAAHSVLQFGSHRLVREVVGPLAVRARAVDERLRDLESAGLKPTAIVVTPQRTMWSGLVSVVARRHKIPTVAVEPHAQDANYSRYVKVSCDYYGVMCEYFRERTAVGFAIDVDRVATIGSPRQVAPSGYDPDVAQREARAAFALRHRRNLGSESAGLVVAFFCQPSAWSHVKVIWETVLRAAAATDSLVLLKTHPEESASRIDQYLDLAAGLGLSKRVVRLETDPATSIELSDLVVTGYSTGAVDAMIRQKPVVCVANGDIPYPVDLPAMLDIPLVRSSEELIEIIESHLRSPSVLRGRALAFLERERSFVDGPGPGLRSLVNRAITEGSAGIRPVETLPSSLLLEGPHPVFTV